jgi:hypothetical protein
MTTWVGVADDGATISVRAAHPVDGRHRRTLEEIWPPVGLTGPTPTDDERALADERVLALPIDEATASAPGWARLESDLALFAAEHLVGRIAIHAALASWNGRTVLLPGPSHVGKSTLASALVDLGADVHADDLVIVDPATGMVLGWDRPLRRRRPDGGVDRLALARPADGSPALPVAVDLVAVLRHAPDAVDPWRTVTAADAVPHLLANTVNARRAPELALDAALAIARRAVAIEGVRAEADAAARALADQLDALPPA